MSARRAGSRAGGRTDTRLIWPGGRIPQMAHIAGMTTIKQLDLPNKYKSPPTRPACMTQVRIDPHTTQPN